MKKTSTSDKIVLAISVLVLVVLVIFSTQSGRIRGLAKEEQRAVPVAVVSKCTDVSGHKTYRIHTIDRQSSGSMKFLAQPLPVPTMTPAQEEVSPATVAPSPPPITPSKAPPDFTSTETPAQQETTPFSELPPSTLPIPEGLPRIRRQGTSPVLLLRPGPTEPTVQEAGCNPVGWLLGLYADKLSATFILTDLLFTTREEVTRLLGAFFIEIYLARASREEPNLIGTSILEAISMLITQRRLSDINTENWPSDPSVIPGNLAVAMLYDSGTYETFFERRIHIKLRTIGDPTNSEIIHTDMWRLLINEYSDIARELLATERERNSRIRQLVPLATTREEIIAALREVGLEYLYSDIIDQMINQRGGTVGPEELTVDEIKNATIEFFNQLLREREENAHALSSSLALRRAVCEIARAYLEIIREDIDPPASSGETRSDVDLPPVPPPGEMYSEEEQLRIERFIEQQFEQQSARLDYERASEAWERMDRNYHFYCVPGPSQGVGELRNEEEGRLISLLRRLFPEEFGGYPRVDPMEADTTPLFPDLNKLESWVRRARDEMSTEEYREFADLVYRNFELLKAAYGDGIYLDPYAYYYDEEVATRLTEIFAIELGLQLRPTPVISPAEKELNNALERITAVYNTFFSIRDRVNNFSESFETLMQNRFHGYVINPNEVSALRREGEAIKQDIITLFGDIDALREDIRQLRLIDNVEKERLLQRIRDLIGLLDVVENNIDLDLPGFAVFE